MRELFARLKFRQKSPDISTFSQANNKRSLDKIRQIHQYLNNLVKQKRGDKLVNIVPIDSTIITLTSKLKMGNRTVVEIHENAFKARTINYQKS